MTPLKHMFQVARAFCVAGGFLLVLAGCSPSGPATSVPKEPEPTDEEKKATREKQRLEDLGKRLAKGKQLARRKDLEIETIIKTLRTLETNTVGTKYEAEVKKLLEQQRQRLVDLAQAQFDAALPEVAKLMKEEDYRSAEDALIDNFNSKRFEELPAKKAFDAKIEEIKLYMSAEGQSTEVQGQAMKYKRQGDLVKAIAMLETYSDRYSETSYYPEIRALVDQYLEEYKVEKAAEQDLLSVEWVNIPGFDLTAHGAENVFELDEGSDTWNAKNSSEGPAQLVGGDDKWLDWFLEFEAKVPDGQVLNLGVRSRENIRTGQREFGNYPFTIDTAEWVKLRVEVREAHVKLINVDSKALIDSDRLASPSGGFAFNLLPGDELSVRKLRFKLFAKIEGDEPKDGEDQEGG